MKVKLDAKSEELEKKFYSLRSSRDIADLLEEDHEFIIKYVDKDKTSDQYEIIKIPKKSGGYREIRIPSFNLKIIQSKLQQVLTVVYEPKVSTHGFVTNRSVITNAQAHLQNGRRNFVLNIDIQDFFPSINWGRVWGMFMSHPYRLPSNIATMLANICCVHNQLPQGAPTSPIVANMICAKLDTQLQALAQENRCFYTRYADDLSFSTALARFPANLARVDATNNLVLGDPLLKAIRENGFIVNARKIRLQSKLTRQEITGIIINKSPNLPRKYINQIRAMLYAWEKYGLEQAQLHHLAYHRQNHSAPYKSFPSFDDVVRGKIEYLGFVRGRNDRKYKSFIEKFERLQNPIVEENPKMPDVERDQIFISYSHRDGNWLKKLNTHLVVVKDKLNLWDDSKINPGSKWLEDIENALKRAKAAILFVSPEFLASEFIREKELKPILEAADREGVKVLWIAVKHSMYEATLIKSYQALNDPAKPLASLKGSTLDKTLVSICQKILKAMEVK